MLPPTLCQQGRLERPHRPMQVLEVNGELISRARIRGQAALLRPASPAAGSLEEELHITREAEQLVVDRVLMEQEAVRLGMTVTLDDVDRALAALMPRSAGIAGCRAGADTPEMRFEVESRLRVDGLMRLWLSRVGGPSPKQIREHYKNNLDAFWSPELVRASQIVKNVEAAADTAAIEQVMRHVRSLLCAGADFGAMVAEYSDCPKGQGDLGYFPRGVMVEEFDAIVFTCPIRELTEVFRTRFGYHLAIVRDRKPEGIRSFDEVREEIANSLLRERWDREVGSRLADLRARAVIRKVSVSLPITRS
jgi:hypothetical protein